MNHIMKRYSSSLTLICLLALTAGSATAQSTSTATKGPHASPEQVKAIQGWTGSLAVQAATYGAPLVAMYNLRSTVAVGPKPKALPGQIWRMENISTPKLAAESGYVSPNLDVIYGFGFVDLAAAPLIRNAP